MSCFNDLKTYCGKDILGEWYHNFYFNTNAEQWVVFVKVFDNISPYAESTKTQYMYQTSKTYHHWTKAEFEKNYKIVEKYYIDIEKKRKAEEEERQERFLYFKEKDSLCKRFRKDEEDFLQYVGYSPCVYVLECCDENFKPIGIKVGSATDFRNRIKTIKDDIHSSNKAKAAKKAGIEYYRPLAYFPTIGENKDISRAYSYKLESSLHIFMERFKNFKRIGNDHFLFTDNDEHFRLYELLEDDETIKDLYTMVENFNDNFSLQQSILETYTKFRYL